MCSKAKAGRGCRQTQKKNTRNDLYLERELAEKCQSNLKSDVNVSDKKKKVIKTEKKKQTDR